MIDEGFTGLWRAARADPRLADIREPIAERATCVAGLAVRAQSDAAEAAGAARPERVEGAWFRDGETRMDDQQHALAGLLRTIPIVEARGLRADSDDDAPSAWLWVARAAARAQPGPRRVRRSARGAVAARGRAASPPSAGRSAGSPSAVAAAGGPAARRARRQRAGVPHRRRASWPC